MTKTFTTIFLGFLLRTAAIAQEYKKTWAEGKLTWQDFSLRDSPLGVSELKYFLGYNTGRQRFGDTVVVRNVANGYIDTKLSWVDPDFMTDQYLRYNQVIFDLVEIYRRRLQNALDQVNLPYEVEGRFSHVYSLLTTEIDKFRNESKGGEDLSSIIFWEGKTSDELERYSANKIPDYEKGNFGYALHAGFGAGVFTGSVGEHFTPTFNFIFGFDFAYKNSIFYLNATLGGGKVKKDYISDKKSWYKGQRTSVAIADMSYGYALIDNTRTKLAPFAGLGITEIDRRNKDNPDNDISIVDYNLIFGLNVDYKLRTIFKLIPSPYFRVKEKVNSCIRTRLYVTRTNYYEDLKGYSINLTVGICGFGNMIRIK